MCWTLAHAIRLGTNKSAYWVYAGARRGLLIRGGDILEAASHVDTVVFDKTGTLTAGHPSVTSVVMQQSALSEHDVLMLAAAVEQQTNHPIAKAIVRRANSTGAVHDAWLLGHRNLSGCRRTMCDRMTICKSIVACLMPLC